MLPITAAIYKVQKEATSMRVTSITTTYSLDHISFL